jgi:hypothetical protein
MPDPTGPIRASDVIPEADPATCTECGMNTDAMAALGRRVATLEEIVERQKEIIGDLEGDLRAKRRRIKELRRENAAAVLAHPRYDEAMAVLAYWKAEVYPNARELGGKRLENVIDRLDGTNSVARLCRAIDGYKLKPYVVNGKRTHEGSPDDWQADAELIFRDAKHVDAGLRIAEHADQLRRALDDTTDPMVPSAELSPIGLAALRYVKAGWAIFPCRTGQKTPANSNGLLGARKDPQAVKQTWAAHPTLNVAIATGSPSGLIVLDVDGDDGMESLRKLEKQHSPLPRTASIVTPSGGQHFYFAHPGVEIRNTAGFPGPHLDIRGDGGYVLAPPSVVYGKTYELDERAPVAPMPAWLVQLLTKRQSSPSTRVDPAVWENMVQRGVTAGERNQQLTRLAGYLVNHLPDPGVVLGIVQNTNRERCRPPLPDREISTLVGSVLRMNARAA